LYTGLFARIVWIRRLPGKYVITPCLVDLRCVVFALDESMARRGGFIGRRKRRSFFDGRSTGSHPPRLPKAASICAASCGRGYGAGRGGVSRGMTLISSFCDRRSTVSGIGS
jgi:hypothetical protein